MSLYISDCIEGYYGEECVKCHSCKNNDYCDVHSGECPNGCQPGYTGYRCDSGKN